MGTDTDLHARPDLARAPDLANKDMTVLPVDLGHLLDLSLPADLAELPMEDMEGPTGLPTCTEVGVTADVLFATVASTKCASGTCHAGGASGFAFNSGSTLKAATVGVLSSQALGMRMVEPFSLHRSYLMYKLVNQHALVGGSGREMPPGGIGRPDPLCKFITWIQEGAK